LGGARLPRCVGIEPGFSLWVFDTDADPDTDAWGEGLPGGLLVCRGCWCPSWSNNGGGLNHEAHKGHETRMGRTGRCANCLSRPDTTTLWLGGGWDGVPG
jgi:hypothetical protein